MAVINRGILGGFRGRVANVVGSSWKGIAVMKSLPLSVANPNTASQQEQRGAFKYASQYGSALLVNWIKPLRDRFAQRESGFNLWVRDNIGAISDAGVITQNQTNMCSGLIGAQPITGGVADKSEETIIFQWNTSVMPANALNTDVAYCAVFNTNLKEWINPLNEVLRPVGEVVLDMPASWLAGHTIQGYLAFKRLDGTQVSDTATATSNIIA